MAIRQKFSFSFLSSWIPVVVALTCVFGIIYLVVQQDMRIGANDPQIQMAEDAATNLSTGIPVQTIVPGQSVDIASSLAPYMMVFDSTGKLLASSAVLDGNPPVFPIDIFSYVRVHGEDRVTWQPQSGVRSAVVVTQYSGKTSGFVMVGRSIREIEKREDMALLQVGFGWAVSIGATFVAAFVARRIS